MFEKDELKLLWPFYVSVFTIMAFFIFMPYWIIFYKDFLSFTQISVLMAIMFITPIFFEVPTGIVADLYGRKFSTLLGYFLEVIIFFILTVSTNYAVLVVSFILFGISATLCSGAENAWAVDWLIHNKKKHLQKAYFRKRTIISNVGQLLAAGIGIAVVRYLPFSYIWGISGIGMFIGACILMYAPEHFVKKKTKVSDIYQDLIKGTKEAVKYTFTKKKLAYATLFLSVLYAISGLDFMSWDVQLLNTGMPAHLFGLVLILNSLLGLVVSMNYHKFIARVGYHNALIYMIIPLALIHFAGFLLSNPYLFLVCLSIHYSIWNSFYYPVSFDYLHGYYTSKIRATLESLTNLITMATMGLFMVVGGVLNDMFGPRIMILVAGVLYCALFGRYFFTLEKNPA